MYMKKIELTQGKFTIVDDEDFEFLNQWKWTVFCNKVPFYAYRQGPRPKRELILMHRLLLKCPKNKIIDHINGDGLDNRKENLRIVTHHQNLINHGVSKRNKSGFSGVRFYENRWQASITFNKKYMLLGRFKNLLDAVKARKKAEKKYFGKYRRSSN